MADNEPKPYSISTIFYILALIVVVIATFSTVGVFQPFRDYVEGLMPFTARESIFHGRLFTKEELSKFTGVDNSDVYLAILGEVFDVTKGRRHYGVGGGYEFFSGKDGTRAFVSGDFTEVGLIEDITGLSHTDILGLQEWSDFYKKDYKHIGHLIGHFYDKSGQPTEHLKDYHIRLVEARKDKQSQEDDKQRFPPCNFEFKQGVGRRIWCSDLRIRWWCECHRYDWLSLFSPPVKEEFVCNLTRSLDSPFGQHGASGAMNQGKRLINGGVKRTWRGVPRQYYQQGKTEPRCACVKDFGAPSGVKETVANNNRGDLDNKSFKPYDDCDPASFQCYFPES